MCAALSFGFPEAAVDTDCLPALCPSCSFIPLGWPPLEALGRPARQKPVMHQLSYFLLLGPGQQTKPEGFFSTQSSWLGESNAAMIWETV